MGKLADDSREAVVNGHFSGKSESGNTYTSGQVTEMVGISTRQLYYWELKGIIKPIEVVMGARRFKRYTDKDIYILKKVKDYLDLGFTLEATFKKIEILCEYLNGNGKRRG